MQSLNTRLTAFAAVLAGLISLSLPARAAAADQTFRHPLGLSFQHPDDWQIGPEGSVTMLVPPEVVRDPASATGIQFIRVSTAPPGITRADDPAIAQALDKEILGQFPFLIRGGDPRPIATGAGEGMALTWDGADPSGVAARARVYAVISAGVLFELLALGARDGVAAREDTLQAIVASFTPAERQRDPGLIGSWRFEKNEALVSGNFTVALHRRIELQFLPDGSGLSSETTRAIGDPGDTGEETETVRFEWFAGSGTLCLIGSDGQLMQAQYELQGEASGRTLVILDGSKPLVLTEIR
jgi:hypothetical protein